MRRWKTQICKLLGSEEYRPETKSGISRLLSVPTKERAQVRRALEQLEDDGKIVAMSKGRFALPQNAPADNQRKGKAGSSRSEGHPDTEATIRFRANGSAYAVLEKSVRAGRAGVLLPEKVSINIERSASSNALHGDRVSLALTVPKMPSSWRRDPDKPRRIIDLPSKDSLRVEGRVTAVVARAEHRLVGEVERKGKYLFVRPNSPSYPKTIHLVDSRKNERLRNGERLLLSIESWEDFQQPPIAKILERLGMPGDPGIEMREILFANGIAEKFPEEVVEEAREIAKRIPGDELEGREDWREKLIFTIDPEDARDFDDAIGIKALEDGGWELAVHIADVSAYVKHGTALDKEAQKRGNSTYLPDRVIPMLPEELSNGLCSLRPGEDRLTRCVVMTFDSSGVRRKSRFISAVIHSARRLTYEEAMEYLNGKPAADGDPIPDLILETWKLASLLRRRRFDGGGLDMDFPEVRVKLDADGRAIDLVTSVNDESHQLIEECMLIANEAVAEETKKRGIPSVYRAHEDPSEERLLEFREIAQGMGFKVGDLATRKEAQRLLAAAQGHPAEQAIKIGFLKSLKRADYRTDPHGHYGLAKMNYTHFTSPIRRYADLIVHRALYAKKGEPRMKLEEMSTLAAHISKTERSSASAEMDAQRLKQYEFLEGLLERDPNRTFKATVVECSGMGLFAEIIDWSIRGLIHQRDLPGGGVYFDRSAMRYSGVDVLGSITVGDQIAIVIKRVDMVTKRIDFKLAANPLPAGPGGRQKPAGSRKEGARKRAKSSKRVRNSRTKGKPNAKKSGSKPKSEGGSKPKTDGRGANPGAPKSRRSRGSRGRGRGRSK